MPRSLEVVGEGRLYLSSDGAGQDDLAVLPLARQHRPDYRRDGVDAAHLCRYTGTKFAQWHGRVGSGYWQAFGPIFAIKGRK